MPTTRKSSRLSSGASAGGKQSTLSFNHRVTKPTTRSAKDNLVKPAHRKDEPSPVDEIKHEDDSEPTSPTTEVSVSEPEFSKLKVEEEDTKVEEEQKSEAELKASQISDAAIRKYWDRIESSRKARAVHKKHTEGLTTGEKVLRYFDVSSQFGVCFFLSPFFCPHNCFFYSTLFLPSSLSG